MPLSAVKTALVALAMSAGAASAATISIQSYTAGEYGTALSQVGDVVLEGFETSPAGEVAPGGTLSTAVGTFTALGGAASGGSVIGTGTNVAVRSGNANGRSNTTAGGSGFLDSNDTWGISWIVSTGSYFNRLLFVLTDATDVGRR